MKLLERQISPLFLFCTISTWLSTSSAMTWVVTAAISIVITRKKTIIIIIIILLIPMIIIVVVVILLLDVTITIKDIVMKLKEEKKKTAMEFNWLCKITTSILQTSYHIVLLSVCLVAHLVLLPFISSFQFYILHFSLFSPLFISEKKKKEDKKKEKQTNTNTRYLSQFNFFPIGKSKRNSNWYCLEQDIHDWSTLHTIHYSTSGSCSSIVFLINWVHQLPTHAFSICFFFLFQDKFDPIKKAAATTPDTAMVAKFVTDQNLHAIYHLIIVCFFSLFFSLSLCSIFLVSHWQLLSSTFWKPRVTLHFVPCPPFLLVI